MGENLFYPKARIPFIMVFVPSIVQGMV